MRLALLTVLIGFQGVMNGGTPTAEKMDSLQSPHVTVVSEGEIGNRIGEGKVVVNFYGNWCEPCRKFMPHFMAVAEKLQGDYTFFKVKLEKGDSAWNNFSIETVPAIIVFNDGREIQRHGSFPNGESFKQFLKSELTAKKRGVQELDSTNFNQAIASGDIIVEFYVSWCPACQRFAPVYEQVAQDLEGEYTFAKLEIPRGKAIADEYQVSHTPTLVAFRDGQEKGRHVGGLSSDQLKAFLSSTYGN